MEIQNTTVTRSLPAVTSFAVGAGLVALFRARSFNWPSSLLFGTAGGGLLFFGTRALCARNNATEQVASRAIPIRPKPVPHTSWDEEPVNAETGLRADEDQALRDLFGTDVQLGTFSRAYAGQQWTLGSAQLNRLATTDLILNGVTELRIHGADDQAIRHLTSLLPRTFSQAYCLTLVDCELTPATCQQLIEVLSKRGWKRLEFFRCGLCDKHLGHFVSLFNHPPGTLTLSNSSVYQELPPNPSSRVNAFSADALLAFGFAIATEYGGKCNADGSSPGYCYVNLPEAVGVQEVKALYRGLFSMDRNAPLVADPEVTDPEVEVGERYQRSVRLPFHLSFINLKISADQCTGDEADLLHGAASVCESDPSGPYALFQF